MPDLGKAGTSGTIPVSVHSREDLLRFKLLSQEVKTIDAAFLRIIIQFDLGRSVGDFQNAINVCRKHVGKVLSQSTDESVTSNMKFLIASIPPQAFGEILNNLRDYARQNGYDGVLQYIHERGKAQESHNSEPLLRLPQAVLASNCCSCCHNSLDILLSILFGNLVNACNSGVLVSYIGRLSDTGRKLRKESKQGSP
ncbi:hypothetical protein LB506_002836 [Fusarium annulatum]|nr:hypothetical protein LB506_002836 [Fusarium annulatum]